MPPPDTIQFYLFLIRKEKLSQRGCHYKTIGVEKQKTPGASRKEENTRSWSWSRSWALFHSSCFSFFFFSIWLHQILNSFDARGLSGFPFQVSFIFSPFNPSLSPFFCCGFFPLFVLFIYKNKVLRKMSAIKIQSSLCWKSTSGVGGFHTEK